MLFIYLTLFPYLKRNKRKVKPFFHNFVNITHFFLNRHIQEKITHFPLTNTHPWRYSFLPFFLLVFVYFDLGYFTNKELTFLATSINYKIGKIVKKLNANERRKKKPQSIFNFFYFRILAVIDQFYTNTNRKLSDTLTLSQSVKRTH